MVLCANNGKYGGSRIALCPGAILNDGLLDLCLQHGPSQGTFGLAKFFKTCVTQHGTHIYNDNYSYFRAKTLKLTNLNYSTAQASEENKEEEQEQQLVPQKF